MNKTSNEGKVVVSKGSDNVAVALPPDVCIVPGSGPAPFPNRVKSDKLLAGATQKTFIDGQPIMTSIGELGPPSEKPHAGTGGGVTSGTYLAEAKATSYSTTMFVEGNAAVRTFDPTTQNHGNTTGIIVPEALADALDAASGLGKQCLIAAAQAGVPLVEPNGK